MDWSVILDGFVLLMAWFGFAFLLYGATVVLQYLLPDAPPDEAPKAAPEIDMREMRITVD